MSKITLFIILLFVTSGCTQYRNTDTNYEYSGSNIINTDLTIIDNFNDDNIIPYFFNYWINLYNDIDTYNFTDTFISSNPDTIQQYYYMQIMDLLNGEYKQSDFEILKNLIHINNDEMMLHIVHYIISNSNVFTYDELLAFEEVTENNISNFDILFSEYSLNNTYFYSALILNELNDYPLDEVIDTLYITLFNENIDTYTKIVNLYFYITLNPNTIHYNDLYNLTNELVSNYDTKNSSTLELYYLSHLINFFNINSNLDITEINFLSLLVPDLQQVYFSISIYLNLNLLDENTKIYLQNYYTSMYNEDNGFGHFVLGSGENINYHMYLLISQILEFEPIRFPNLDRELSSNIRLGQYHSNSKLYTMSLFQLHENGLINKSIQREVMSRLNDSTLNEDHFYSLYHLFLIAYNGGFKDNISNHPRINEVYLLNSIEENLYLEDLFLALLYFDILTLYYPNNEHIDYLYYNVKELFYIHAEKIDSIEDDIIISYLSLFKTIEFRIGKFEHNIEIIEQIYNITTIGNFPVIMSRRINSLNNYFHYYYVLQLFDNYPNPILIGHIF